MTQAVLWDLGGVLLDWSPAYLYRQHFDSDDALDHFLTHICSMQWHAEHDRGVPMAENRKALVERHPEHRDAIEAWETGFDGMLNGAIDGTPDAMNALADKGVPQYALTNLPAEWVQPVHDLYPEMRHMRDVVVSAHEGVIKPDRRIYEITAERVPFDPSTVLFFDDRADNVAAAREFGFDAEQFTGRDALFAALKDRKLLP